MVVTSSLMEHFEISQEELDTRIGEMRRWWTMTPEERKSHACKRQVIYETVGRTVVLREKLNDCKCRACRDRFLHSTVSELLWSAGLRPPPLSEIEP